MATDNPDLTHFDASGRARQVDVGDKPLSDRRAEARGLVRCSPATLAAIRAGGLRKGDPLEVARIAAVLGAKRTPELIPLCHSVPLSQVDVSAELTDDGVELGATVRARWNTGVEMEALTAVTVAALTVYDMLKSHDKGMTIERIRLVLKTGGKSGDWRRQDP